MFSLFANKDPHKGIPVDELYCEIWIIAGEHLGEKWRVDHADRLIGRELTDSNAISFSNSMNTMSKKHATFIKQDDGFFIKDHGSANGTVLNKKNVQGEARLKTGDVIEIGLVSIKVKIGLLSELKEGS